jgi:hypothetical protein
LLHKGGIVVSGAALRRGTGALLCVEVLVGVPVGGSDGAGSQEGSGKILERDHFECFVVLLFGRSLFSE